MIFTRETECELCGEKQSKKEMSSIFGKRYCHKCGLTIQSMIDGHFSYKGDLSSKNQQVYDYVSKHINKPVQITEKSGNKNTSGNLIGIIDNQFVVKFRRQIRLYSFPDDFKNNYNLKINNKQIESLIDGDEIAKTKSFAGLTEKLKENKILAVIGASVIALLLILVIFNPGETNDISEKSVNNTSEDFASKITESEIERNVVLPTTDSCIEKLSKEAECYEEEQITKSTNKKKRIVSNTSTKKITTKSSTSKENVATLADKASMKQPTTKITTTRRQTSKHTIKSTTESSTVKRTIRRTTTESSTTKILNRSSTTDSIKKENRTSASQQYYILNINPKKDEKIFHNPGCFSVKEMNEENILKVYKSRDEIIADGYRPCGHCHP